MFNNNNGNWIEKHLDSGCSIQWKELILQFRDYLKSKRVLGHFDNLAYYLIIGLYEIIQPIGIIKDYYLSYLSDNQKERIFQASVRCLWRERKRLSRKTEKEVSLNEEILINHPVSEVDISITDYKEDQKYYLYSHKEEIDQTYGDKATMILKLLLEALPHTLSLRFLAFRTGLDKSVVSKRLESLRTDANFFISFLAIFQSKREREKMPVSENKGLFRDSLIEGVV